MMYRGEKMGEKKTKKYTPMMQQYLSIKQDHPDVLLFFRLGDFYELFFEDAIKTSKLLEITLTSRANGEEKIPMCGVPHHAAQGYIQKLIDCGEKIAIAEQTSEPTKGIGLVTREVTKIITPGTFVQEGMFESANVSYMFSCHYQDDFYSLCYGDISIGTYFILERIETATDLVDYLRMINPMEVVIDSKQKKQFLLLEQQTNYLISFVEMGEYNPKTKFLEEEKLYQSFSILMHYLHSVHAESLKNVRQVKQLFPNRYLKLNAATIASLELFETLKTRTKEGSLFGLLNRTKTSLGARKLKQWIAQPLVEQAMIEYRHDIVGNLYDEYLIRKTIQQYLVNVYDIERILARIVLYQAQVRELHQLKITLKSITELKEYIKNTQIHQDIQEKAVQFDVDYLFSLLDEALATEDIQTLKETGIFKTGYHKELDELRLIAQGGTEWLVDLEQKERIRTGIKNLRIKYNKVFGYFIEISKGNATLVQDDWGYVRKQTLSNAERFITEELKQKEEQILSAAEKITILERFLFQELCQKIIPFREMLMQLADWVAELDVLQAFAEVSQDYGYVRPFLHQTTEIFIEEGRHPIVEQVVGEQFIANDTKMEQEHILLITGPNMAGKSTYMRQVALIAILNQIGCFVSAKKADLPIFDAIFTRIGAQDDLFSGESTFMVEMKEVAYALKHATHRSLLCFDEVGRGTATYDGLSLAYAILKYIQEKLKAKTLFSTHYHELTELSKKLSRVKNVHVSATLEEGNIYFHHHIREGSVEKSYGVQVAKLAHLPLDLIEEASTLLYLLEQQHQHGMTKVSGEQIKYAAKERALNETLEFENNRLKRQLKLVQDLSLDDMTPKEAWSFLENLQKKCGK